VLRYLVVLFIMAWEQYKMLARFILLEVCVGAYDYQQIADTYWHRCRYRFGLALSFDLRLRPIDLSRDFLVVKHPKPRALQNTSYSVEPISSTTVIKLSFS
jgi:hypothetical protein